MIFNSSLHGRIKTIRELRITMTGSIIISRYLCNCRIMSSFTGISSKIKNLTKPHIAGGWEELMIHPMDQWHLYTNFNGENGRGEGRIQFVWLFGIVGVFVLSLACINFMNLSTARSEKRAKEVGIRKTMGSLRRYLILQFIGESLLMTFFALIIALIIAVISLPSFNLLAGKHLFIPFLQFPFWICILGFTFFTGVFGRQLSGVLSFRIQTCESS